MSIEDAAAWQRRALTDDGDFSTPVRALPLTGMSELNPLASDSTGRSGIESAIGGATNVSFHSHSKSLDGGNATHRRRSSLDKDDSALNALNIKDTEAAVLPPSDVAQQPQQPQQQHEQHFPLEPPAPAPGHASGAINASAGPASMLKSLARTGSAHQLGATESIARPVHPMRYASEPSLLQPRQPPNAQTPPRADTPRPAPLPADSDCPAALPSSSIAATAVPAERRGSQSDISQPQHRREKSEDLRMEEPAQPRTPSKQPQDPDSRAETAQSKPDSTVPSPTPVPAVTVAPSKNLRIFLHETEVGRNLMLSRLCSGGIFLKLGARGSPHYRLVRVSPDLISVTWCDLKHSEKVRGSIPVLSISRVDRGHASKIFRDRAPKSSVAMHCFSLRSEARTLDLECCSQEEADLWVLAFGFLIEYTQKRRKCMPAEETASQLRSDDEVSVDRTVSESYASGSTAGHRPRKRSISIVSALDVLCDHSRVLSEPNTPQTNSDLAILTGRESYSSDDLLPALPPEIMFDASLNPCRAATAATAAAISSSASLESITSGGSNSSSCLLVPALLPAAGSLLDADATADVHLLTQCLPLSMARQIDSSLDATLDGELSLEIDGAVSTPPKGASPASEPPKAAAEPKQAVAEPKVAVAEPPLPPPIRVPLPSVAEVEDVSSAAAPASTIAPIAVTATAAPTTVPEVSCAVERLTTAPSSFPDQAPSAKETTTSTEPAARSPQQPLAQSSDPAAEQLQREFHRLSELNQQANRIYTPILPDANTATAQQQQPQLPNFPLCFPGGRLTTGFAAPSDSVAGCDGGACQTPFLLDHAQFAQQDIFDLSTFAHLAAETAAEYGRVMPQVQFEEMHAAATAAAAAAAAEEAANATQGASAPSTAQSGAASAVPAPLVAPQAPAWTQSQLRALHDQEVSAYIAIDPRLSRIHRNLCKYRAEYHQLEESFAAKLGRMQMELDELQARHEKLKMLHEKVQVTTREKRAFALGFQAFRASLAPGSSTTAATSASASPHIPPTHTPGSGVGSWAHPMQQHPEGNRVAASGTAAVGSHATPTFVSPDGAVVAAIL